MPLHCQVKWHKVSPLFPRSNSIHGINSASLTIESPDALEMKLSDIRPANSRFLTDALDLITEDSLKVKCPSSIITQKKYPAPYVVTPLTIL